MSSGAEIIELRRARPDEAALLGEIALAAKAHWGYSADFMQACRDELIPTRADLERAAFEYVVIVSDRSVSGFYAIEDRGHGQFELEALFVRPALIGRGYGRRLMHHACDRIAACGGATLTIQSDPNAADFYAALGARHIGDRESDSVPGRMLPLFAMTIVSQ